jgi:hypothetical protein
MQTNPVPGFRASYAHNISHYDLIVIRYIYDDFL